MLTCTSGIIKTIYVTATLSLQTCAPVGYVDKVPQKIPPAQVVPDRRTIPFKQRVFNLNKSSDRKCTYSKRVKVIEDGYFTGYEMVEVPCGKYNRTKNKVSNNVWVK